MKPLQIYIYILLKHSQQRKGKLIINKSSILREIKGVHKMKKERWKDV